jgi:hypothetical protein
VCRCTQGHVVALMVFSAYRRQVRRNVPLPWLLSADHVRLHVSIMYRVRWRATRVSRCSLHISTSVDLGKNVYKIVDIHKTVVERSRRNPYHVGLANIANDSTRLQEVMQLAHIGTNVEAELTSTLSSSQNKTTQHPHGDPSTCPTQSTHLRRVLRRDDAHGRDTLSHKQFKEASQKLTLGTQRRHGCFVKQLETGNKAQRR